jgi:hypothetical protein
MSNSSSHIYAAIDSVAKELPAAMLTLHFGALLPPDSVPWPWLQALTVARRAGLPQDPAEWEQLKHRLTEAGLLINSDVPEVAEMPVEVAIRVRQRLDANAEQELRREILSFTGQRLTEFKALTRRLTDEVLRGANGGKEVTAWTVPSAEKAAAQAAGSQFVQVIANGDGSFNIGLREGALWEEKCLKRFCSFQFASEMPESIEWALRTNFVPGREITNAKDRITKLREADPASVQIGVIYGLMLLNLAHDLAGYGSWRGAWHYAGQAVDVFDKLHQVMPENGDVSSLLKEARHDQYLYDD